MKKFWIVLFITLSFVGVANAQQGGGIDTTLFVPAQVYPNPFVAKLNIKLNKRLDDLREVSIYDAIGNEVYSFNLNDISGNIVSWGGIGNNGSLVSPGVYVCLIRTKRRSESFLIQRQ
jgi:Secretion system C-terminal sorting domain